MKISIFDTHQFEKEYLKHANEKYGHELIFVETRLNKTTASLAKDIQCISTFVNDTVSAEVLEILKAGGTKLIAQRAAGYNNIDIKRATELGIKVVRVPAYSPYAVAEHTVALILSLNRKIHRAYNRTKEGNFSLDGLVGFDLHSKTIGIIGTGKIGKILAKIMRGFGCHVLLHDKFPDHNFANDISAQYVEFGHLLQSCDIISLNIPLNKETLHLINEKTLSNTKNGVMLINTGRGGIIETKALIKALKSGHIGSAGLDVYEEEENYFFKDLSDQILGDDDLARLISFPNVLLTGHQAFLTQEALSNISSTTLGNINEFQLGKELTNEVRQ